MGMEHRAPCKHIFCPYTHPRMTPAVGSKGQIIFLLKLVMLQIKLKGIERRAPYKHIFCSYTHPQPQMGLKGQNIFSESSHVAYQISDLWVRLIL